MHGLAAHIHDGDADRRTDQGDDLKSACVRCVLAGARENEAHVVNSVDKTGWGSHSGMVIGTSGLKRRNAGCAPGPFKANGRRSRGETYACQLKGKVLGLGRIEGSANWSEAGQPRCDGESK